MGKKLIGYFLEIHGTRIKLFHLWRRHTTRGAHNFEKENRSVFVSIVPTVTSFLLAFFCDSHWLHVFYLKKQFS